MDHTMLSAPYAMRCKFVQTSSPPTEASLVSFVYRTFDEFHWSLVEKEILHPSEERHRQKWLASSSKAFDVINSYHAFCTLCQKHFYSRSVPTDINSFFEEHLNTDYHREARDSEFPHSKEMISWEKIWITGRCNVCQKSGLLAVVKRMEANPSDLLERHLCFGNLIMYTNNLEFYSKMSLLKKFCKLSIFRDKFIKPLNDGNACLICYSKIPWSGEDVRIHLGGQQHLSRFFRLIYNRLSLSPKDLLNGFNLEIVMRWIYKCAFKCPENLEMGCELSRVENFVTSPAQLKLEYRADSDYYYYPIVIERFLAHQSSNFIENGICLLCDLPTVDTHCIHNDHFSSEYHEKNSANLTAKSLDYGNQTEATCANQNSRLQHITGAIENYKQLKDGSHIHNLKLTVKNPEKTSLRKKFFNKLSLIKKPPTNVLYKNYTCEVCDVCVPALLADEHETESRHLYYCRRWQELEKDAADKRFFEPFQKINNMYICVLCGVYTKEIFQHLKDAFHAQRFRWYCTLDSEIPISSAIEVRSDLSVVCYLCDEILLEKQNAEDFKRSLKGIRNHWPCLLIDKVQEETNDILNAGENLEGSCLSCGNSQQAHKSYCPTNALNCESVENAIQDVMETYEEAISESVLKKTSSVVHDIRKAMKRQQQAACECKKSTAQCEWGNLKGGSRKLKKMKSKKNKGGNSNIEEEMEEKEQKVLVISGLPKDLPKGEIRQTISSKLSKFGKINTLKFEENMAEVVFFDQGVAERVVPKADLFPNSSPPVTMTLKLKKVWEAKNKSDDENLQSSVSSKSKFFFSMPSDLLELLQQPTRLLKFISDLTAAATAVAESSTERIREKLVCETIIDAVRNWYPKSRCYPFGSRLSGLMFSDSDLDVFLDCGGMYEGMKNTSRKGERILIHRVAKLLHEKKQVSHSFVVDKARVPIISFLHEPTGLHCDLSVKSALSLHNSLLIKFLISSNIQVKSIIIFFKYWVKRNGLHGQQYFSSYAITMMAIFYLQQIEPPMVPTIEKLQNAFVGRRLTIGGWDCSFSGDPEIFTSKDDEFPLNVVLQGFFSYFADFEYDKFAISPLDGKPLPRKAFSGDGLSKLPMCYKRHILNIPQPMEKLVCQSMPICVFDPIELSHVLTKNVSSTGLEMFKHYCRLSANALKKNVYLGKTAAPSSGSL